MIKLNLSRVLITLVVTLAFAVPAGTRGDTLRLLDGTVLRGKILSFVSDTLIFHTSFGSDVKVGREKILSIAFTDSVLAVPPVAGAAVIGAAVVGGEPGQLSITFKDRKMTSKIIVTKGQNEKALIQANWIEQILFVDGDTVFAYVDSMMDKTIYKGPQRQYKNTIELEDILVELAPGPHQVTLVIRSQGIDEYGSEFDGGPLNMNYIVGDIQVYSGRESRVNLGLDRGKLRTKAPKFKRLD